MISQNSLKIFFPGKLVFANGCIAQLPDEIALLNVSKVFIATIAPLMDAIEEFVSRLKSRDIEVITDTSIVQEPSFNDFEKLMRSVNDFSESINPVNPRVTGKA